MISHPFLKPYFLWYPTDVEESPLLGTEGRHKGKWRIRSWAHSWFKLLQDKVFFPSMWHQCNLSSFKPSVGTTIYSSCIEFCTQHVRRIMWKEKAYRQTHQINTLTMNSKLTYVGYYYFRNYFSCLHIHILNSLQCVWGKTGRSILNCVSHTAFSQPWQLWSEFSLFCSAPEWTQDFVQTEPYPQSISGF